MMQKSPDLLRLQSWIEAEGFRGYDPYDALNSPLLSSLSLGNKFLRIAFGSREAVSREAAEKLVQRYPGLRISGRANGYLKEEEMPVLVKMVNESGANIMFVALGSPKQ